SSHCSFVAVYFLFHAHCSTQYQVSQNPDIVSILSILKATCTDPQTRQRHRTIMTSTASQQDMTSTSTLDRRFPRTLLVAGYILDAQTSNGHSALPAFICVEALAYKKYGITMKVMGEEVTLEDMTIMVVTQSRDFPDGCVGYPADKLPHFKEGAREARVLLKS
ncbi:hypothetical protein CPB85DRAFT_1475481, partial [Mucidula mucida]